MLVGFLFPLTTNVSIFKVVTWNIPALVLVFWIALRGVNRQRFRLRYFDTWDYSIIGIILIYTVMTLLGNEPIAGLLFLNSYSYCLILALYFRRSWGSIITPRSLIIFAFLTVGLESIIGLIQQITSSEFGNLSVYIGETPDTADLRSIGETDMGRVHGTLGTGNLVGSWINIFIPFILFGSQYMRIKSLWLWRNLIIIFATIAILLTISRFNIALFSGILLFTYAHYLKEHISSRIKLRVRSATLIFIAALLFTGTVTTVVFWEEVKMMKMAIDFRFSDTFEEIEATGEKTSGVAARMEMNKGAMQAFLRSPIIGLGYNNSRWIWPTVDTDVPKGWIYQPHNLYMIMLVEGGITLFIAYFLFTMIPFYHLWRCRKKKDPFLLGFFLSLSASLGIQMIYIIFTSPNIAAVYMLVQGMAMGYMDTYLRDRVQDEK